MNQAPRSYNDKQLDTIARSVFYDTLKYTEAYLKEPTVEADRLTALAAALDGAVCGFDTSEEHGEELSAAARKASPYNDDLLNEIARGVYVTCIEAVQGIVKGTAVMNSEKLEAFGRLADACANGFNPDEEDDE
jgi:hypothetical protein